MLGSIKWNIKKEGRDCKECVSFNICKPRLSQTKDIAENCREHFINNQNREEIPFYG
jgi:hypothetical protein